jgi:hypothetical protein
MRQAKAGLIVLVAAMMPGCFTLLGGRTGGRPSDTRSDPLAGPPAANVVQLDVAVLERPAGDDFLNRGLWELADEQVVSLERKPELDDNGIRVAQVGGQPPAGLQSMLTSPRSNPEPHRARVPAGNCVPVALGPASPYCWFRVHGDGADRTVELRDAAYYIDIVPSLVEDGRVGLHFTPRIKHGPSTLAFAPQKDPSGALRWDRAERQPEEEFDRLGWDVTVAPNEFVVIGTRPDRPATLGQACFLPVAQGPRVQRLLVIRTARCAAVQPHSGEQPGLVMPLAARAALQAARGTSQ